MKKLDSLVPTNEGESLYDIEGQQVIIDRYRQARQNDLIGYELFGQRRIGRLSGQAIITSEGEVFEGEILEEAKVLGKVSFVITSMMIDENRPF